MSRPVYCEYLKHEAEGLPHAPWPGELGRRVYAHISREAWALWLQRQTMLINEYRLSPLDPQTRILLAQEMEQFLFGGGEAPPPPGYQPPDTDR